MAVGGGVIGALRVVLGADTAAFETGLKKSASRLDKFAATAVKVGGAIGAAMGAAAAALGIAVKSQLNEADKLGKMAQSIGVPVEELSALKHAADLSGVSLEGLSKGLGRLNRNIVESAQGLSTPTRAFAALGIQIRNTDGSLKTVGQILPELAGKFSQMRDGPEKTALAMQLLGRAGADMIPLLNAGSAGLAAMIIEARELGLVITTQTATAAERFNDNLTRLSRVKDGIIIQLTAKLAPAFATLTERLVSAAKEGNVVEKVGNALITGFEAVARAVKFLYDNMGTLVRVAAVFVGARLGAAVLGIGLAFIKFAASIRLAGIALALFNVVKSLSMRGLLLIGGIIALATGNFDTLTEKLGSLAEKFASLFPTDVSEKITSGLKGIGLDISALTKDFNEVLPAGQAAEKTLRNLGVAIENDTEIKKRNSIAEREKNQLMREGQAVYEQTRTPLEALRIEFARLNTLLQAGAIDYDTYNRAIRRTQDEFTGAAEMARSFGSSLEGAFVDAVVEGKKLSEVAKSLLKDLARLAAQAAFRSLVGGFGNFGGGGGFRLPGFASGGSFQVGGSGGIDSQLVAFKASPNERVSVTKPGQEMGGGQNVTIVNHNDFRGVDPSMRAWIMQQQQLSERRIMSQVPAAVGRHKSHNPSYLRGGG